MNESKPMKWWLISNDDVQLIFQSLMSAEHEANDFNCPHPGDNLDKEACSRCEAVALRHRALYALNTGLHKTDAIPDDWREGSSSKLYIDFGWANGWANKPRVIGACEKLGHKKTEINRDPSGHGLHMEVRCEICKYIYHYDSSG